MKNKDSDLNVSNWVPVLIKNLIPFLNITLILLILPRIITLCMKVHVIHVCWIFLSRQSCTVFKTGTAQTFESLCTCTV